MWHSRAPRLAVLSACLALILAFPSLGSTAAAAPKRVTAVTVKDFGSKLVIGIVATGTIVYQVTEVTTPPPLRVVVDILDAVVDDEIRTTTEVDRGPVSRVRVGQFQDSPAIARVVIDLTAPLKVDVVKTSATTLAVSVPLTGSVPVAAPKPAPAAQPPVASKPVAQAPPPTPQPAAAPTPAVAQAPPAAQAPPGPTGVIRLLEFRGVPLAEVLSALARLCGWNIVTDAAVQGSITLRLVNVTCEEALRFILEANNLGFRRIGNNLIITSAERLQPPAEVPETIAYRLAFGDVNAIRAAIAAAVPGIRVAVDPRTNSLLITATAAQHEEVRKVLLTLDIRIQQVMIQVHAIEVNRSSVTDLGLLDSGINVPFGSLGFDAALGRIFFTLTDATLLLFRLRALIDQRAGRVLAAPRIATLDGNRASILLGDQFPVIQTVPGAVAGTTTQTVTFVPVGVKLEVTPRINSDGLMTVIIKPEVSSVVEIITTTQGTRAPRIATRSAETTLTVADGQSIVLGGLISQEERRSVIKVPLLGDIPILGELFRFTTVDVRNTELIFVITPTILKD
jgi:type II secretory pathway component GspD/PulD (secretin)